MGNYINYDKSFGLQNTLQGGQSPAIISPRAPTVTDFANPGQFWVRVQPSPINLNTGYLCMGSVQGQAIWSQVDQPGNNFQNLTVNPGPTNLTGIFNVTGTTDITGPTMTLAATGAATFQSTTGKVNIIGGDATLTSVEIENGNFGGGITIAAGQSGMVLTSTNTSATSIAITANTGTAGITLTGGTGTSTFTSAGTTKISSSAVGSSVLLQTTNNGGRIKAQYNTNSVNTGLNISDGTVTGAIFVGTGAPAFAAIAGSLFIRTDGTNNGEVLYVNFDGGAGNWGALT